MRNLENKVKIDKERFAKEWRNEKVYDLDYTKGIIEDMLNKNYFEASKYIDEDYTSNEMSNDIISKIKILKDIYKKQGKEDIFNKQLEYNPYSVISDATNLYKKTLEASSKKEMEILNSNDEKTGRFTKQTTEYFRGKNFYNNLIKDNGLSKEFMQKAKIGIYGGFRNKTSINYEAFKQSVTHIKRVIDGHEETGIVSVYYGAKSTVYIIEWQSSNGIEILTENEYKSKYGSKGQGYKSGKRYR